MFTFKVMFNFHLPSCSRFQASLVNIQQWQCSSPLIYLKFKNNALILYSEKPKAWIQERSTCSACGLFYHLSCWRYLPSLITMETEKISTVGIVTVNYDYLFLQNPGSVTASQEESEKSYSGVPKKRSFSQNSYIINFTTSFHIYILESYTIIVFGWFQKFPAELNPRWTIGRSLHWQNSQCIFQLRKLFPLLSLLNPDLNEVKHIIGTYL